MNKLHVLARHRWLLGLVGIALSILLLVGSPVLAGDEDGVAGYKFKIYDPDGDGIDGNEGGQAGGDGGALSSSNVETESTVSRPALFEFYLRIVIVWWLR
jgi:hypothetical protein